MPLNPVASIQIYFEGAHFFPDSLAGMVDEASASRELGGVLGEGAASPPAKGSGGAL